MDCVLAVPELVDRILQCLDNASNASNARVCKIWSEIALDIIWKEVVELHPLLSLLAPLAKSPSGNKFKRRLEYSDWDRFERYRYRVRKLAYRPSNSVNHCIDKSVFDQIMWTRTSKKMLPKMHTLEWHGPLDLCIVFMHKNVETLALSLPLHHHSKVSEAFGDVIARMSNVYKLDLRFDTSVLSFEADIVRLIQGLPNLEKIILPAFSLTNKVAESASRLRNLKILRYTRAKHQGSGEPADILNFEPALSEDSFSVLTELSMNITYERALGFLANLWTTPTPAPYHLTFFCLESPVIELPSSFFRLAMAIADACPSLKTLQFCYDTPGVIVASISALTVKRLITIDALRPLFRCKNLRELTVVHPYPLLLQLADVEEIATSWPAIETLALNCNPNLEACSMIPMLTLDALVPFARHCPVLSALHILLNAWAIPADPSPQYALPSFKSLKALTFGISPISFKKEGAVALFLSQICPLNAVVQGIYDDHYLPRENRDNEMSKGWKRVNEHLPFLIECRMEERNRSRDLKIEQEEKLKVMEQQLHDSRIELQLLRDKLKMASENMDEQVR
ncbi:hypothetical protein H0H92_004627 [Tricholoma furcatifolium]|nr:hypothetical protein H0H92_004627 [Tricholoma furcatifolium]